MDALSEVLRMIRLRGAFFLNGEFHEPWCVDAPRGTDMAHVLCPGAKQLAILHMVLEGRCWIQVDGGAAIPMEAGDVVALPAGDAHLIGSGIGHAPVDARHMLPVKVPEIAPVRYGGDGEGTLLACGWFAYEGDVPSSLLAGLPRVIRVSLAGRPAGPWIEQSVRHALREAAAGEPGSRAVAAKVAEAMFVETLRAYVDGLPAAQGGCLAGLRDPVVGRCLALMHEQPGRGWTLESLAQAACTSRSVLAGRFTELVGVAPMQYLKRWRLAVAARLLCAERVHLVQVAEAVGYESEASFSRAFKGEYGVAPGAWRSTGGQAAAAGRPAPP